MPVDPQRLAIVHYPDPILRTKAKPVPAIDEEVRAVARRMIELMHEADGIGLAAPQVGLPWRMFVTRGLGEDDPELVFINPILEVIDREGTVHEEGCLSLPGINVDIRRPKGIRLTAQGLDGKPFTLESAEFPARVWQHEHDHLEGVLIINRMSPMDRLATRRALKDLELEAS